MSEEYSFIWGTDGWGRATKLLREAGIYSVSDVEALLATPAAKQFSVALAKKRFQDAKIALERAEKEARSV